MATTTHSPLDSPIWLSLTGNHAAFALGNGLARRYPRDMGAFAAVAEYSPQAFAELADLTGPQGVAVLVGGELPESEHWTINQHALAQLVCDQPLPEIPAGGADNTDAPPITPLTAADVPEVLELIKLTQPGPFFARTIELGTYLAIRQDGKIVAMAGERLYPTGYREISAVCTHPSYQKRGYARRLVTRLVNQNLAAGNVPFLHTGENNLAALALYKSLGFTRRPGLALYVMTRH